MPGAAVAEVGRSRGAADGAPQTKMAPNAPSDAVGAHWKGSGQPAGRPRRHPARPARPGAAVHPAAHRRTRRRPGIRTDPPTVGRWHSPEELYVLDPKMDFCNHFCPIGGVSYMD